MYSDHDHSQHPDGIGNNQLMSGTSHPISLGTAALLMMGLTDRVASTTPAAHAHLGNGAPVPMRLQAAASASKSGHVSHTIEVPMDLDVSCERHYCATALTDALAQEHGFPDARSWRRELGIKKDTPASIYSYPVVLTHSSQLPLDPDRTGSRLNGLTDAAYDAWQNASDRSIQRAHFYFDTLPEAARDEALERIAPYRALNDDARVKWLSSNGQRPIPSDLRALRTYEPVQPVQPEMSPAAPKPPREKLPGKLTQGYGWELVNPSRAAVPRERVAKTPPPSPDTPKTAVRTNGEVSTARLSRHAAAAIVIKKEASEGFDGLSPRLQDKGLLARETARFAAGDEAKFRRAQPRKKTARPVADSDDSLKSTRGR